MLVCKRARLAIDLGATIMSIALIVLIDVEGFPRIGLSIIAAAVAVMLSADKVGAFGARWLHYRLAAEELENEVELFRHSAGPYRALDCDRQVVLVERMEAILQREARGWIGLTRRDELSFDKKLGM